MKAISVTVVAIWIGVVCLATYPTPTSQPHIEDGWRRTVNGWERMSFRVGRRAELPLAAKIHPAVVAGMIVLLSLAALTIWHPFETGRERLPRRSTVLPDTTPAAPRDFPAEPLRQCA